MRRRSLWSACARRERRSARATSTASQARRQTSDARAHRSRTPIEPPPAAYATRRGPSDTLRVCEHTKPLPFPFPPTGPGDCQEFELALTAKGLTNLFNFLSGELRTVRRVRRMAPPVSCRTRRERGCDCRRMRLHIRWLFSRELPRRDRRRRALQAEPGAAEAGGVVQRGAHVPAWGWLPVQRVCLPLLVCASERSGASGRKAPVSTHATTRVHGCTSGCTSGICRTS